MKSLKIGSHVFTGFFAYASDYIKFEDDAVTISDADGEVVHWVQSEWEEDPTVVLSIANAVRIAASGLSVRRLLEAAS